MCVRRFFDITHYLHSKLGLDAVMCNEIYYTMCNFSECCSRIGVMVLSSLFTVCNYLRRLYLVFCRVPLRSGIRLIQG